ncbi:MAG TPA: hypothetical protein VF719_07550 [Abditibacteriaceae bacterium]
MEYVLAIAVITWGGVFAYLMRMETLVRRVEQLAARESDTTQNVL